MQKTQTLQIVSLTEEFAKIHAQEILSLEHNWKEIGDDEWNIDNLIYFLPMKWELSHVALLDGKIIGYQVASNREGAVFLNKIVVDKSARKTGAGKQLIKAFLVKAMEKKIERVIFRVRTDNPAVEFYEKLGFHRIPGIDRVRPDGVTSYYYDTFIENVLTNL